MRLALASDIHLEFGLVKLISEPADVLILAGDIFVASQFNAEQKKFLVNCSHRFKTVLYIPGNHEYYDNAPRLPSIDAVDKRVEQICDETGLTLLNRRSTEIAGITFFGATLWTDCDNGNPSAMVELQRGMSDFEIIQQSPGFRFRPQGMVDCYRRDLSWLAKNIPDSPTVVVTHHLPSPNSVPRHFERDTMNPGFCSDLRAFIAEHSQIVAWCHGHTHNAFDYKEGGCRIVCNPRGYYGIETWQRTFHTKIVEV